MPLALVLAAATLALTIAPAAQSPAPVRTANGLVAGSDAQRPGVRVFKGIPYAAPPVGERRWRAPQPAASWSGIRRADTFSSACMQDLARSRAPWTEPFMVQEGASEDCLYLNVWVPAAAADPRPVLVYVHGGGFREGSGAVAVYDGTSFAAQGLVVVTLNYRLGAFGFFADPRLADESPERSTGNYGLLDVVAALRWVQQNIAVFGGDPARVTVAGQSAGASTVHALTRSPLAHGLFHRAIAQSGSSATTPAPRTADDAATAHRVLATKVGATTLAELRAVSASNLLAAAMAETRALPFGPVRDDHVLPLDATARGAAGLANDVPVLTGMNADERSSAPGYGRVSRVEHESQAKATFGDLAERYLALYPAATDQAAGAMSITASRDRTVTSLLTWAERRAASPATRAKAFLYYFTRAIPWPERPEFGAFHTGEMPYVFGSLGALERPWTDGDRRLSETMTGYWSAFIRTGDPNGQGRPPFPAYTHGERAIMELGTDVGRRQVTSDERFQFWLDVLRSPVASRLGLF